MKRTTSIFGWKVALKDYGWKGFCLDSILPVIISSFLCVVMYWKDADVYVQLKHIVEVGIDVVPAMVALILTAYTIMLTFIIGDRFSSIKNTQKVQNPDAINYLVFFFVCYSLIYSVSILIGIVIDIFNSGQTVLLDDGKK